MAKNQSDPRNRVREEEKKGREGKEGERKKGGGEEGEEEWSWGMEERWRRRREGERDGRRRRMERRKGRERQGEAGRHAGQLHLPASGDIQTSKRLRGSMSSGKISWTKW